MRYITVDQFQGASLINVYVMDDRVNDLVETEQDLTLAEGYEKIEQFKKQYGINNIDFKLYDNMENLIRSESIAD